MQTIPGFPERGHAADRWAGFFTPLCVFIEPGSRILLADKALAQAEIAFPISLLLTPIFGLFALSSSFTRLAKSSLLGIYIIIGIFIVYCLVTSAVIAALGNTKSILFAVQWVLFIAWMPYFTIIATSDRIYRYAKWFTIGTVVNILWYFIPASVEIVLYGHLQDGGRMSQNLIFPGQYQIAIYVPTVIALSISLVNAFAIGGIITLGRRALLSLNALAALTMLALASREGILVFLLIIMVSTLVRRPHTRMPVILSLLIIGSLVAANITEIFNYFSSSEFRILNKIARLQDPTARFGGRDAMIADSLKAYWESPFFGSHFLPPNEFNIEIVAPSAHNMYVDAFVWTGLIGGSIFLTMCLWILARAFRNLISAGGKSSIAVKLTSVALIVFMLVSNNTNVPMRQPVMAPLVALMIAICLFSFTPPRARPE